MADDQVTDGRNLMQNDGLGRPRYVDIGTARHPCTVDTWLFKDIFRLRPSPAAELRAHDRDMAYLRGDPAPRLRDDAET
jgi:hypothetical protein